MAHSKQASKQYPVREESRSTWTSSDGSPPSKKEGRRWFKRPWRRPRAEPPRRLVKGRLASKPSTPSHSVPLNSNVRVNQQGRLEYLPAKPDTSNPVWQGIDLKKELLREKKRADYIEQKYIKERERANNIELKYRKLRDEYTYRGQKLDERLKSQELKLREIGNKWAADYRDMAAEALAYQSEASRQQNLAQHWQRVFEHEAQRADSLEEELERIHHPRNLNAKVPDPSNDHPGPSGVVTGDNDEVKVSNKYTNDIDDGASNVSEEGWEDITDSGSEAAEIAFSPQELHRLGNPSGNRIDGTFKKYTR